MKESNVEQIIQELATANFNAYPESYPLNSDGTAIDEATTNAQELAISYYDNRNEEEVERDEELNITKVDYVDFVMEAFSSWVQEKGE